MGNNRLPTISRIDQSVRDTDFIPITDLSEINQRLNEIIDKFNSSGQTNSETINIAQKLKDIEYNMADALVVDSTTGEIIGYNTTTDDEGNIIPLYGEDSIDTMLNKLQTYYNELVKNLGGDPNEDNWKIPLNEYFNEAITNFRNKIAAIFTNSSNVAAMEAKYDENNDYVKTDPIKPKTNVITRLNPDMMSYMRSVNIIGQQQYKNLIAFEVQEAESNSLVLNLKIQNGFLYYDLDIVLDNGKWYISKKTINGKEINSIFKLNIFKYPISETFNSYVFCLYTNYPDIEAVYNFEIQGVFVQKYSFNNTNLTIENHDKYYEYVLTTDTTPIFSETYYVKTTDSYEEENAREIWVPHTNLTSFENGVEYYTRTTKFTLCKSHDLINDPSEGIIQNNTLNETNDQVVVDKLIYNGSLCKVDVSYDISEALDECANVNTELYIKNNPKCSIDDSVQIYSTGTSTANVVNRNVKKVDNKISCGYGEALFDMIKLKPNQIVNCNTYLNKSATNVLVSKINEDIEFSNEEDFKNSTNYRVITKYDILQSDNPDEILKIDDDNENINEYFRKNLSYVNSFTIFEFLDKFGLNEHIIVLPDFEEWVANEYDDTSDIKSIITRFIRTHFYTHFITSKSLALNDTNPGFITVPVFRKMNISDNMYMNQYEPVNASFSSMASNGNITIAIGYDDDAHLFYSYYGDLWYRLEHPVDNRGIEINFRYCEVFYTGEFFICTSNDESGYDSYWWYSDDGLTWKTCPYVDDEKPYMTFWWGSELGGSKWHICKIKIINSDRFIIWINDSTDRRNMKTIVTDAYHLKNGLSSEENGFQFLPNYKNTLIDVVYNGSKWLLIRSIGSRNIGFHVGVDSSASNIENLIDITVSEDYSHMYHTFALPNNDSFGNIDGHVKTIIYPDSNADKFYIHPVIDYLPSNSTFNDKLYEIDSSALPTQNNGSTEVQLLPIGMVHYNDTTVYTKKFINCSDIFLDSNGVETYKTIFILIGSDNTAKYYNGLNPAQKLFNDDIEVYDVIVLGPDRHKTAYFSTSDGLKSINLEYLINVSGNYPIIMGHNVSFGSTSVYNLIGCCCSNKSYCNIKNNSHSGNNYNVILLSDHATTYYNNDLNYDSTANNPFILPPNPWLEAVFASYNPIRNLYECDDRIVGETNLGPMGINYGYDDAYDPYRDYNLSTIEEKITDPKLYKQHNTDRCYMEIDETNEKAIIWSNSSNNRKYNIAGFTPSNYFFISNGCNDGKEYIFFTSEFSTGIWYADFSLTGSNISLTHIDIPIYATAMVENKYGAFVYGFDQTFERQKLYTNGKANSSFVFEEALDVEMIDFFKAHNDEIIISTYDSEDPNAYYTCNMHDGDEFITFNHNEAMTVHDRFSFNEIIEYKGEIYFLNGSGSHPEVDLGLYKYQLSLDSNGNKNVVITQIATMEENYFDGMYGEKRIDIIPNVENPSDPSKTACLVSISGYNDMMDDSIEKILVIDIESGTITDLSTISGYNIPYSYKIISEIRKDVKNDHPGKFTNLVVQHSSYHVDKINTYNFNNQIDYKTDEFYFDLKNKTISLNNYEIANDKRFVIETEKIAIGTNISEPKTNIVFILGQDNALALYDRSLPNIKVIKTKYVDTETRINVPFDIDKNTLQSVIIGNGNTDKQVYVIVQGKFPKVINNYNTGVVTFDYDNSEFETRLYSASINHMLEFDNTDENSYFELNYLMTYNGSSSDIPSIRNDFKNFIRETYPSLHLSDDLPLYHDTTSSSYVTEYLGSFCNLLYDNTYSSVYWNIKKHCLQIKTKLKYHTSLTKKYDENVTRYYTYGLDENENPISLEKNKTYLIRNREYMIDVETNEIIKNSSSIKKWYYPINITNKKIITPTVDNYSESWTESMPNAPTYNNKDLNRYIIFDATTKLFKLNYIQHMQTQYGVFRFTNKSYMDMINEYYKFWTANNYWFDYANYEEKGFNLMDITSSIGINNERYDITNLYFTPEGSNSIITIKPVNCGTIEEVYETYKGLFIYTKELKEFDGKIIESHNMYRLKRIPDTNIASTILLTDNEYFTELDIDNCTITDFRETKYGIFAIGYEPDEMWDMPQDSTGEYHGANHIFWYNGDDFISLVTYTPSYRGVSKPLVIIETREYVYIAMRVSYGLVNFLRYDPSNYSFEDVTSDPNKNLISSRVSLYHPTLSESTNYNSLISALIGHRKSMIYPKVELDIENYDDKIVCWNSTYVTGSGIPSGGTVVWNFETRSIDRITTRSIDSYGFGYETSPLYYIKYPIFENNNSTNENVNELLTKLHDANIPINKNIKAVGAIFYRNHKILINGIKLISNLESEIPQSIIFNIDPDFRLDNNVANATLRNSISDGKIKDIQDNAIYKANFTLIFDK
jgi:hypothetical protein